MEIYCDSTSHWNPAKEAQQRPDYYMIGMFAVNLTPTADAARVQNRRAALWGNKAIINQNQTPWRQTWIQMSHDPGAALLVYCPDYSHETRSQNMNENHTVISQECPDFYKLRDIIQLIVIYAKWVIGAERSASAMLLNTWFVCLWSKPETVLEGKLQMWETPNWWLFQVDDGR